LNVDQAPDAAAGVGQRDASVPVAGPVAPLDEESALPPSVPLSVEHGGGAIVRRILGVR
jgi:hypothetical protein